MGIGPTEDLPNGEAWQVADVAHAASPGQKASERRAPLQSTMTLAQGVVDRQPRLAGCDVNLSRQVPGPLTRTGVMGIGPR
jgi:hypothetical protein